MSNIKNTHFVVKISSDKRILEKEVSSKTFVNISDIPKKIKLSNYLDDSNILKLAIYLDIIYENYNEESSTEDEYSDENEDFLNNDYSEFNNQLTSKSFNKYISLLNEKDFTIYKTYEGLSVDNIPFSKIELKYENLKIW